MTRKLFMLALAATLTACGQGNQTQPPAAQSGQAPASPAQPANSANPTNGPASKLAAGNGASPGAPNTPSAPNAAAPTAAPPAAVAPGTSAGSSTPAAPAAVEQPRTPDSTAAATPPAASATSAAPSVAEKAAPAKPQFEEITIPAGTALSVSLTTPVASDSSRVEDEVRGRLSRPVVIGGITIIPAEAEVSGTVRGAKRSGRVKGLASVSLQFERLIVRGESMPIRTALVARAAKADRKDDVKKGAIGAAAGAIIGGIAGGGKGAAIGAGVGGAGTVVATRGDEIRLPAGTVVRTTLRQPLTVLVPAR